MNRTQELHRVGQSLWLDNITRVLLDSGALRRYIGEFSITGLTSNPTIFDQAIGATDAYDEDIRAKTGSGQSTESLFFELALEDLRRAADLFRPIFDATNSLDGWVSIEPLRVDRRLQLLRRWSMTSKTTNKFSSEVRARAVRMVLDHEGEHASRWAAVSSIAAKIGCTAQTLHEWVKKAERDSGVRAGVPTDVATKLKALERENRELRQANEILRKASAYFAQAELDRRFRP